jgi:hypothetical protein
MLCVFSARKDKADHVEGDNGSEIVACQEQRTNTGGDIAQPCSKP